VTREELVELYGVDHASPRVVQFLIDLHDLCVEYKVTIGGSGYDGLEVSDLDDYKPIWFNGITDCTEHHNAE
jgi:hypothetical protein